MTLPRPALRAPAGADVMFPALRTKIVALAARGGLPAIYNLREFVSDRGLMSHGPSDRDAYVRAAMFAGGMRKRAGPGDLPVAQPTRFAPARPMAPAGRAVR